MDTPFIYEIRVQGYLSDQWSAWFDGLAIQRGPNGETALTGLLADQAVLFGLLHKIHNLNLVLVSVVRLGPSQTMAQRLEQDDFTNG